MTRSSLVRVPTSRAPRATPGPSAAAGSDAPSPRSSEGAQPAALAAGVHLRWTEGRPLVVLAGDVDLVSAPHIASAGLLLPRWAHPVSIDAAAVTFMDVAGLRAVLALAGTCGAVELRRPSRPVLHLLQVLRGAGVGVPTSRVPGPSPAVLLHQPPTNRLRRRRPRLSPRGADP
ncbi:STAS domain-containing protein [Quadrisphaera sp. KR29]|uniref:STAS domain-containing protein n=1 Tax=Quadrisphaera sp. KR29 TaxID=3461391 RepID=UPI0040446F39